MYDNGRAATGLFLLSKNHHWKTRKMNSLRIFNTFLPVLYSEIKLFWPEVKVKQPYCLRGTHQNNTQHNKPQYSLRCSSANILTGKYSEVNNRAVSSQQSATCCIISLEWSSRSLTPRPAVQNGKVGVYTTKGWVSLERTEKGWD